MTELKEYTFDELYVGQTETFSLTITESMINEFSKLSGDLNPLHMDDEFAKSTNFEGRLCHGMLLSSFFSRLVGMLLPGKNALYFSQTLNFKNPCFVNDQITIEGKIIDKSESTQIINLETKIFHKNGKCLVDGNAKVMIRNIN